jgi:hypothetical protein
MAFKTRRLESLIWFTDAALSKCNWQQLWVSSFIGCPYPPIQNNTCKKHGSQADAKVLAGPPGTFCVRLIKPLVSGFKFVLSASHFGCNLVALYAPKGARAYETISQSRTPNDQTSLFTVSSMLLRAPLRNGSIKSSFLRPTL